MEEHTLSEQDLETNPGLKEEGLEAGDIVGIPSEEEVQSAEEAETTPSEAEEPKEEVTE